MTLPITVAQRLHDAMVEEMGEPWASSYLSGARTDTASLLPRTVTAWKALNYSKTARKVLKDLGFALVKPLPFHEQ